MRVLQVTKFDLEKNGIATFINFAIEQVKSNGIEIDVFVPGSIRNQEIKCLMEENGAKVFVKNVKKNPLFRFNSGIKLYLFLKNNQYDIIHINSGDSALQASMTIASKLAGRNKVIVHSHGCINQNSFIKKTISWLSKKIVARYADAFIACSEEAGKSAFSNCIKDVTILQNGIDPEKYRFNAVTEQEMRKFYNAENCKVIGHVGSFIKIKNHEFLIDVFEIVKNKMCDAKLLLLGDGEERENIENNIKSRGLQNSVILTGNVDDVPRFLQMMDVFVFPSIKEGTPFACLEAQAAGIPCVFSTGISEETIIDSNNVTRLDLSVDKAIWADKIVECANKSDKHIIDLKDSKYDIRKSMIILEEIYKECVKKRK